MARMYSRMVVPADARISCTVNESLRVTRIIAACMRT